MISSYTHRDTQAETVRFLILSTMVERMNIATNIV